MLFRLEVSEIYLDGKPVKIYYVRFGLQYWYAGNLHMSCMGYTDTCALLTALCDINGFIAAGCTIKNGDMSLYLDRHAKFTTTRYEYSNTIYKVCAILDYMNWEMAEEEIRERFLRENPVY